VVSRARILKRSSSISLSPTASDPDPKNDDCADFECAVSHMQWDYTSSTSLQTLRPSSSCSTSSESECIYTSLFSPHSPQLLGSTSSSGRFTLYDLRLSISPTALDIQTHEPETLTFDWNKYQPDVIATGGVDGSIRVWDLRMIRVDEKTVRDGGVRVNRVIPRGNGMVRELRGHRFAVKRVQ
jgi:peroxin-7